MTGICCFAVFLLLPSYAIGTGKPLTPALSPSDGAREKKTAQDLVLPTIPTPVQRVEAGSNPGTLTLDAYVWQRVWDEPVRRAVGEHAGDFAELVPLAAEIVWRQKQPSVVRVPVDYATLRRSNGAVGLALRIGPFSGPFEADGPVTTLLSDLASTILNQARAGGVEPAELQIDFDCAESKLEGYRTWIEAIRKKVAPTRVVITALPSWLNQTTFKTLAEAAGGFVLQVHSLERPKDFGSPFSLCDPDAARRAVERAGLLGVPFRVALPTYGYLVAFSAEGRFIGLSAEGPRGEWPAGTRIREVLSNPVEIAGLVREWSNAHPAAMTGIIWYRLPISLDKLNWPWTTLSAVMTGRAPRESVVARVEHQSPGLVEISLVNDGEAGLSSQPAVEIRWQSGRLVAADGLRGFEVIHRGTNAIQLQKNTNAAPARIWPGEKWVIGWLRLDQEVEVHVETKHF